MAHRCPSCRDRTLVPIVFGMPSYELFEAAERGEVVLGGCVLEEVNPTRRCTRCGWEGVIDAPDELQEIDRRPAIEAD